MLEEKGPKEVTMLQEKHLGSLQSASQLLYFYFTSCKTPLSKNNAESIHVIVLNLKEKDNIGMKKGMP